MVYIWRNTVIEKWQRDCRPKKPPYSSRHPAPTVCRAWNASLSRCAWPLLIRSLATPASLNEGFPEIRHRCLRIALSVVIACQLFYRFSHNVRETSKTNKWRGLEGNYWVGADTSVYHAWPSGKGIKVAYHRRVRQRSIQTRCQKVN